MFNLDNQEKINLTNNEWDIRIVDIQYKDNRILTKGIKYTGLDFIGFEEFIKEIEFNKYL
ncbi:MULTISPECIES: hypothetical protein [Bacillus]|uniref:hypothetical protein n=1 Tax=Bacillus TaxID=1386 RepID=UPI002112F1C6|nr:hypothetical protein [Bacillus paranthracis]MCQ6521321.1 hypothetical protein [Bacillus paranthracis]MCU5227988.1 hypothetical protein [Bacillus paranthracis]MEC4602843.1 hypothetical protein [Bacillus paranthracis]